MGIGRFWRFLIGPFRDLARLFLNACRLYGVVLPALYHAACSGAPTNGFRLADGRNEYAAAWRRAQAAGQNPARALRNLHATAALVWGLGVGIAVLGVLEHSISGLLSGVAIVLFEAFSLGYLLWQARIGVVAPYAVYLRELKRQPKMLLPLWKAVLLMVLAASLLGSMAYAGSGGVSAVFDPKNTLATQYLKMLFGECLIHTSVGPCSIGSSQSFIMVIMGQSVTIIQGLFVAVLLWIVFYGAIKNATEGRFLGNWDKFKVPASIIISVLLMANVGGVFFSQIVFVKMTWWGSRTADEMWHNSVVAMSEPTLLGSGIPEIARDYFDTYVTMRLCAMQLMKGRGFAASNAGSDLITDTTAQQALGRDIYLVCGVDRYFSGNPEFAENTSLQSKMNGCFREVFDRLISDGYIRLSEQEGDLIGRPLSPAETLTPFYVDQQLLLYGKTGKPSLAALIGRLEASKVIGGRFLYPNGSVAACIVDHIADASPAAPGALYEANGDLDMVGAIQQSTLSWAGTAMRAVVANGSGTGVGHMPSLGHDLGWLVAGREQQLVLKGIKQYTANLKLQPPLFRFDEMGRDFRNLQIQAAMAMTLKDFVATTYGLPNVMAPSAVDIDSAGISTSMADTASAVASGPQTGTSGGYRIGSFRTVAQTLGEYILMGDAALSNAQDKDGKSNSSWNATTRAITALVDKVAKNKSGEHNLNARGATKYLQKKVPKDAVYMLGLFLANLDLWPALIMTFAGIMWLMRAAVWYMLCPLAVTLVALPNTDVGHNAGREMFGVAWSPVIIVIMFIASLFLWDICILLGWDILMNDGAHPLSISTQLVEYLSEMVLTGQYLMNFLMFMVVVFSSFFMCAMLPIHGTDIVLKGLGLRGSVAEIGSDELGKIRGALSNSRLGF